MGIKIAHWLERDMAIACLKLFTTTTTQHCAIVTSPCIYISPLSLFGRMSQIMILDLDVWDASSITSS